MYVTNIDDSNELPIARLFGVNKSLYCIEQKTESKKIATTRYHNDEAKKNYVRVQMDDEQCER